ncbi:MAG: tRNA (guanosine(46)-N7)-methyltransferase TrmB [Actinomycetaceae bacterium]|nr:tRNA (guanosine(46)-N7)-methyltransferase TrmB [Actinomycetaceae bacterium]
MEESSVEHRIRSFSRRGGRMGKKYDELLSNEGQNFVISLEREENSPFLLKTQEIDLEEIFGRKAPLAIEIGPGSGEQCVHFALEHPDWNILAIEAWRPGVGRIVSKIVRNDVSSVRVMEADAAEVLPIIFGLIPQAEVNAKNGHAQEIWTFFPDPWRKKRHHKRRLVSSDFSSIVADSLCQNGIWRLATDWDNYAWQMRNVVEANESFTNPYQGHNPDPQDEEPTRGGFSPRWDGRVMTRFEQRGIEAGRTIHDITGVKN